MRILFLLALAACADRTVGTPDDEPACTHVTPGPIATVGEGVGLVHAAWNGDGYGLVWYGLQTGTFFARADAHGAASSTRQLSPTGLFPRVAFDGKEYGVAFVEGQDLVFVRLDRDGAPVDRKVLTHGARLQNPVVAAAHGQWAVLVEDLGVAVELFVGDEKQTFGSSNAQYGGGNPLMATDDGFVVAWTEFDAVHVSTGLRIEARQPYRPALARGALAWMDVRDDHFAVELALDAGDRFTWSAPGLHVGEPNVVLDDDGIVVIGDRMTTADSSEAWRDRVHVDGSRDGMTTIGRAIFPFVTSNGCQSAIAYVDGTTGRFRVLD